jgi:hypothetical protein
MGYSGKDGLQQEKPHEARKYIRVWKTEDGIIILRAAVNNTGAGNHGIHKVGRGVISTMHGMIKTKTERLNTRTWEARGGGREGSYHEDHYPYAWRDVVDDTVHEEDFQDMHDENNHVPRYPSFYGNVYDRTECYPESPPFRSSEWDDDRGLCTRIIRDDINIMRGGGGNSSREMNRDNEDIHNSHSW